MKNLLLSALVLSAGTASAAVWSASDNTVGLIPDGSSAGLARSLNINASGQAITNVQVNVNISATLGGTGFLGDIYLYLTNGTDLAILANRPGSRSGVASGYSDNQSMDVSFSPMGTEDFHIYRIPLTGSHTTALSGGLTGTWGADGRLVDPSTVLDTSPRTAGLDVFNGDNGDGTWSLFVADMSSGGTHQLNSWSLEITTIPEPHTLGLGLAVAIACLLPRRRPGYVNH